MFNERRKHMRFDANINGEFTVRSTAIRGLLTTDNFSHGGFKAVLNQKVDQGAELDCEMTFPETIMPFFSSGKIVWIKEHEVNAEAKFDAGIELEQMDSSEKQFLVDYCYKKWNSEKAVPEKKEFDLEL